MMTHCTSHLAQLAVCTKTETPLKDNYYILYYLNLAVSIVWIRQEYKASVEHSHYIMFRTIGFHIMLSPPIFRMVAQEYQSIVWIKPLIIICLWYV